MSPDEMLDRVDRFQQRTKPLAFVVAVFKRFSEDRGSNFAALISYYGFLSLFPLLLALVTIAGIVLADNPDLQHRLVNSVADRIPVVGTQLESNVTGLRTNGAVLAIGLAIALLSGLRVVQVTQEALNTVWDVPRFRWPNILARYGRNAMVLGVLGLAVIAATAVPILSSLVELHAAAEVLLAMGNVAVNAIVILLAFQVLIQTKLEYRDLVWGAVIGGLALYLLQLVGGIYVSRVVTRASDLYGVFATVIGLMVWLNLNARVVLLTAEIDVVRERKLWPRSISPRQLTDADRDALQALAAREALIDGQSIVVDFAEPSEPNGSQARVETKSLACSSTGEGPQVVLAHGFTQTGRCFGPIGADLAADHTVSCPDLPGHGDSGAVDAGFVEAATLLGEACGQGTYIGYSMGGRLCLQLALARPDLVDQLVLVSCTAGITDDHDRAVRRQADAELADHIEAVGTEQFLNEWLARPMFAGLDERARSLEERRRNTPAGLAASLRRCGTGSQPDLWPELGGLDMSVLIVTGEGDAKFCDIGDRLAEAIGTNAERLTIEGAGHAAHLERPEEFLAALRARKI